MTKNINSTLNATGNVDFFTAYHGLSVRVAEFFCCVLRKKEIQIEYDGKIAELQDSVVNLEKLGGSILAGQIDTLKAGAFTRLGELEAERQKLMEEQAKFVYTDADKAFKKALAGNPSADVVAEEVCAWFKLYGLDIHNTLFLEEVLGTFGMKIDLKTLVRTEGRSVLKVDANNALKNMYACAYEHMVMAGTIKAAEIPELVREKYMPKKTSKKEKKAAKKAAAQKAAN